MGFRERQYAPLLIWIVLVGMTAVAFVVEALFEQPPGGSVALGLAVSTVVVLALFGRMTTDVRPDGLVVTYGFVPVYRKRFRYEDIADLRPERYRPLREFGGWGIRGWGNHRALSIKGDLGLRLYLRSGQVWMLGSSDPEALARAVRTVARGAPP